MKHHLLILALTLSFSVAQANPGLRGVVSASCGGSLNNGFGPYDYRLHANSEDARSNPNNPLFLVHSAHFRPEMEALRHGGQGPKSSVAPEFDYTLRAFPNHHRALIALMRLAKREGTDQPKRLRWPVECYFERAIAWTPDDVVVRMLHAKFLTDRKQATAARAALSSALGLAADNPLTHHNIGLLYLELGDVADALQQSHRAASLGMLQQTLKDRLVAGGHWKELATEPSSEPASNPPR